jgi:hypothetical protein
MARPPEWSPRVVSLIQSGNLDAAVAQIKVAPSVRDLRKLQQALVKLPRGPQHKQLDLVMEEQIALQSAPRLHRSP